MSECIRVCFECVRVIRVFVRVRHPCCHVCICVCEYVPVGVYACVTCVFVCTSVCVYDTRVHVSFHLRTFVNALACTCVRV